MRLGPALLFLPVVLFAGGLLRVFVGQLPAAEPRGELLPALPAGVGPVGAPLEGFGGRVTLEQGDLVARLVPYHRSDAERGVAAAALRERLGIAAGDPWRLDLRLEPSESDEDVLRLDGTLVAVYDADGEAARVVPPSDEARERGEPLVALFGPADEVGVAGTSYLLFGRAPGEEASLRLAPGGGLPPIPLEPASFPVADVGRSFARVGDPEGAGGDPRDAEIARLRERLAAEVRRRQERELAWYEFNRALVDLGLDSVAPFPVDEELIEGQVEPGPGDTESGADAATADVAPAVPDRSHDVHVGLRTLLRMADLQSYDLIESGTLSGGAIGPVVFRLLDDRGRLAGSMMAERLRLEGSRSGRTVTIVLEEGHESRGGERYPFHDGVRRVVLPYVDPGPWMESLPELFPPAALATVRDDGLWDREAVRRELNRLLSADTSAGWYRLQGLGGVVGDDLLDVQLEAFDADGRIDRRFFADELRLFVEPPGVLLRLQGGVIQRGQDRQAFLDGVHRIFLPRARLEDWEGAHLPGL